MVFCIAPEEKNVKLRVWICGYSTLCVVHAVLLCCRRNMRISISTAVTETSLINSGSNCEDAGMMDKLNAAIAGIWWIVGIILISTSYNNNTTPHLFWLTVAFLASEVFYFALDCVFMCLLLAAGSCICFPCFLAFMFYSKWKEHASEADNNNLRNIDLDQPNVKACIRMHMGTNGPNRALPTEDMDCCICLGYYEDGEQPHFLPCTHHFHSTCITKWIKVKPTCPVCQSLIA